MAELYWPFSTNQVSEWPGTRPVGWADHVGTDFAVAQGAPLRATMSGTVDVIWNDGLGAWVIDIINPDGTVVRNGHMSRMDVIDGQWVNAGDHIGLTGGALGTPGAGLSTGSHLHWEIRNNTGWGNYGWYDPRHLTIKTFGAAPKPKPTPKPEWEDTLYAFSGKSTRKKAQKIKGGAKWTVTFLDSASESKWGDRTIARGPGDIVGLNVNIRVKGEPGTRVNYELVRETGQDKNRVVIGEGRTVLDTFGAGTVQIGFSGDLKTGQLIRLLAQVQSGKTVEVERFYWSGMARPA